MTLALKMDGFKYVETGDEVFQTGNNTGKVQGQVNAGEIDNVGRKSGVMSLRTLMLG